MRFNAVKQPKFRSLVLILVGGILPIMYIAFLLIYNYQDNKALQYSSVKKYKLDIENQIASLGYFFLERKYDIRSRADSTEILTYFTNRGMGMSEQYGLRVSLFSIEQMLKDTTRTKNINGAPIYKKFVFLDRDKKVLVDTSMEQLENGNPTWQDQLDKIQTEPGTIVEKNENGSNIILVSPCFFKKKVVGWLAGELNLNTLHTFFVVQPSAIPSKIQVLALQDGNIVAPPEQISQHPLWPNIMKEISENKDLKQISIPDRDGETTTFLFYRTRIQSSPLFLAVYAEKSDVVGDTREWQTLVAGGAFIFLTFMGLFLYLRTNTKHLILTARVDEANKQQLKLEGKNSELTDEINKRKQIEHVLVEKEERYRKLFEFSSDAIFIIKNNIVIDCNQKSNELLGYSGEDIIKKEFHLFAASQKQPSQDSLSDKCLHLQKKTLNEPQHFEWMMTTASGNILDVEINMIVMLLEDEVMIQAIVRDVSERKLTQELLVQTEKMMAVGGLAAGMAHEINNPLGIIMQSNQNIRRRLGTNLKKNQAVALSVGVDFDKMQQYLEERSIHNYLELIHSASERAAKIVKSMLEFGRSRAISSKELCDVEAVLEDALEMAAKDYDLKRKFNFNKITITRLYHPVNPVMCEKTEISQVLINIIKNAAQAMHKAGTKHPAISCTIESVLKNIRITIKDNGPGMSEEVQKQIFQPFFTTKPTGEGTGLGLSVSYFIVKTHHNGNFTVASTEGQGARFTIELPC